MIGGFSLPPRMSSDLSRSSSESALPGAGRKVADNISIIANRRMAGLPFVGFHSLAG